MTAMTHRERILAFIQGREQDRVPFVQYSGIAAPNDVVWDRLGRNNVGILKWSSVHSVTRTDCGSDSKDFVRDGKPCQSTTIHTPAGSIFEEREFEPVYNSSSVRKHFVETPQDLDALIALLRRTTVHPAPERYHQDAQGCGDDGLPLVSVGRSPYQQLWVQWTGLENLAYLMADCPDQMAEVFDLLSGQFRHIGECARQSDAPFVDIADNITAPAIGPAYFARYCAPLYRELVEMMGERPVFVHMDGDLKPLWDEITRSGIRGLDSFSPPPDNDTSVADAVRLWPQMRLGVNFPSSVHLQDDAGVYEAAMQILHEGGHTGRLQIQISENVPRDSWARSYAAIVRAISDYGKPGTDAL